MFIRVHVYGNSHSSLSLASSYPEGILLFSLGEGHVWVNWLKPCTPIVCNTEHMQFVNVSKVAYSSTVFMRDEGCNKFFM